MNVAEMKGLDVSNNNGHIVWPSVAADGFSFAWIKATEGRSYSDPYFDTNLRAARQAGIAVGAYHFARPDNNTAAQEASHFLDVYRPHPGDLLPVLDFETHADLSPAAMTAWAAIWMELVKQGLNCEVVLYTYPYFISADMGGAAALKGTKLWYADYSGKPWKFLNKDRAKGFNIVAQQYTSNGRAGGINGRVDLNYAPKMAPIMQGKPKPAKKGSLPGPTPKPKWFWSALKTYLKNRQKNA